LKIKALRAFPATSPQKRGGEREENATRAAGGTIPQAMENFSRAAIEFAFRPR
jgi:hypothetical protein